jgi:hypothetical protein
MYTVGLRHGGLCTTNFMPDGVLVLTVQDYFVNNTVGPTVGYVLYVTLVFNDGHAVLFSVRYKLKFHIYSEKYLFRHNRKVMKSDF